VNADPRRQTWGNPTRFLDERTKPATDDFGWTAGATIYAHYQRWCYLRGFGIRNKAALAKALRKRAKEKILNDLTLFSLELIVPSADEHAHRARTEAKERVNGEVVIKRDLQFVDGVLPGGTVLPWMTANEAEKADFEAKRKRQQGSGETAYSWLVVQWQGRRRRIPGDAAERV